MKLGRVLEVVSGSVVVYLAVAACGCATVDPGAGTLSKESVESLARTRREAALQTAERAVATAIAAPDDDRRWRKAAEIGAEAIAKVDASSKTSLSAKLEPVGVHLAGKDTCVDAALLGDLQAARDDAKAPDLRVVAARRCRSSRSVVAATTSLRGRKRCPEANALVAELFSSTPSEGWVDLLDEVVACSDAVSVRKNLSFAPRDVLADYARLLERRERRAEAERQAAAQAAREERQEQARSQAKSECQGYCRSAEGQCRSSCGSIASCYPRCDALGSSCLAGCS